MAKLRIHPLLLGRFSNVEKSIFTYGCNQGIKFSACCIGWYIEGAEKRVLVDTGPSAPDLALRYHPHLGLSRQDLGLRQALSGIGIKPQEIDLVVLTHLHWDHCYNLELLSRASFLVQKEEIRYAVSPLPVHQLGYEAGVQGLCPAWMSVFDRIRVTDGDEELLPGLKIVTLPGHTPGFQGVLVEAEKGRYLIAGDAMPLFENWEKRIPHGVHVDLHKSEETFKKVHFLHPDVVLPGHDEQVFEQQIYPR